MDSYNHYSRENFIVKSYLADAINNFGYHIEEIQQNGDVTPADIVKYDEYEPYKFDVALQLGNGLVKIQVEIEADEDDVGVTYPETENDESDRKLKDVSEYDKVQNGLGY